MLVYGGAARGRQGGGGWLGGQVFGEGARGAGILGGGGGGSKQVFRGGGRLDVAKTEISKKGKVIVAAEGDWGRGHK